MLFLPHCRFLRFLPSCVVLILACHLCSSCIFILSLNKKSFTIKCICIYVCVRASRVVCFACDQSNGDSHVPLWFKCFLFLVIGGHNRSSLLKSDGDRGRDEREGLFPFFPQHRESLFPTTSMW